MNPSHPPARPVQPRDVRFFSDPTLWPTWPVLPVVRRQPDGTLELGVLYDLLPTGGPAGFRSTVFRANLFGMPLTLDELMTLPREVFDTPEEMAAAGWTVD